MRNFSQHLPMFASLMFLLFLVSGCDGNGDDSASPSKPEPNRPVQAADQTPATAPDHTDAQQTDEIPDETPKQESVKPKVVRITAAEAQQPIYRPSDTRQQHDDDKLAAHGIFVYESRRLKLYTDIAPEVARSLPELIDRAYDAWEDYFGALPPNRERTDFQITGYLMSDRTIFQNLDLLPDDLPSFFHGRHRGAEFWMNDQEWAYYRRHLLIHEATHCFMTYLPGVTAPVWYLEGMAELFGNHRTDAEGKVHFRVMPHDKTEFRGLGRIKMIQDEVRGGTYRRINDVVNLESNDFLKTESYAWSWAMCQFLDTHPHYKQGFRDVAQSFLAGNFSAAYRRFSEENFSNRQTEWALFVVNITQGYDFERAAVDFATGTALHDKPVTFEIQADRGWQSSGIAIKANETYDIQATGQFSVAQDPQPWVSEAQGVSIRYFQGKPLGMLLAAIRLETATANSQLPETMLQSIPIGREQVFVAPVNGTLYFRLNDDWSELADNAGQVSVTVRAVK